MFQIATNFYTMVHGHAETQERPQWCLAVYEGSSLGFGSEPLCPAVVVADFHSHPILPFQSKSQDNDVDENVSYLIQLHSIKPV